MAGLLGQWLARLGEDVAGVSDALFGDGVERQLDQEIRGIDDALGVLPLVVAGDLNEAMKRLHTPKP